MSRWTRRIAVSAGMAVAAVGIAVPLTLGSASASAPSALTAATSADAGLGSKVPAALKADLKAAWASPDGQRVAALQAVLAKAVSGAYGEAVQAKATRLQGRLAKMNAALKEDVDAAIELPKAQRQAAFKAIKAKVQSGGYGAQVQRRAHLLQRLRSLRG